MATLRPAPVRVTPPLKRRLQENGKGAQRTIVTNIFLVNLSVADLLVTLFCMPVQIAKSVTLLWYFGEVMCKTVNFLQAVCVKSNSARPTSDYDDDGCPVMTQYECLRLLIILVSQDT
ncbi:hypothetical protein MSG28_007798 [Choristoneura fumiferana]|uniref:Uncharacterized protein n=1 Tax=Choristoneura fumiferana TaxID=7141 RepID=A0ACC0JZ44_CHOFU|nr:hypothetical protein MSG28_007798 [Choristoneura fumiferana]